MSFGHLHGRRGLSARAAAAIERARAAAAIERKDPRAQVTGMLARRAGASLEGALAAVHAWYDRTGVAAIEKVNPPVEGWGESIRVGASTVDYTGSWHEHGWDRRTMIAFDAKMMTSVATFGPPSATAGKGRDRRRFFAQVAYLQGLRDRHGYRAFFLLYCSDLDTLWLCSDLDTLARGESVPIRTKPRPTKASPTPAPEHHLPHLVGSLDRAGVPQLGTRRPLLDYLRLLPP